MSRRLQILLPDKEYETVRKAARKRKRSLSQLALEGLQLVLRTMPELPVEERLAKVMRFARCSAPTADIEEMLVQIQSGQEN